MTNPEITIPQPDDWHLHLRDGEMLDAVIYSTARHFRRAIVMPNLKPPVTTASSALAYRERVLAAVAKQAAQASDERDVLAGFEPLMTCYLTDNSDAGDLVAGARDGIFAAAKLYPAGATTNSDHGVTSIDRLDGVFAAMSEASVPLLIHGEVVDTNIDIFDREAIFIETVLEPLRHRFPQLRIVLEHITTAEAAAYVAAADPAQLAATITPHHLALNRNAMFEGGMRPHAYCLPVIKREKHRLALVRAATGGGRHFFLGTDSAPHLRNTKESSCGCAGIFNAATALASYLEVFENANALDNFERFASLNGPAFYRLPVNTRRVTWERCDAPQATPEIGLDVEVFTPPGGGCWRERTLD